MKCELGDHSSDKRSDDTILETGAVEPILEYSDNDNDNEHVSVNERKCKIKKRPSKFADHYVEFRG